MKLCTKCGYTKPKIEFHKDSDNYDGLRHECKKCRSLLRHEHRKNNLEKFKLKENSKKAKDSWLNADLKRSYGISLKEYDDLVKAQDNKCKICNKEEQHKTKKRLTVDHCHVTNKIRGLLCHRCNCALGLFFDNPDLLKLAIQYLKGEIEDEINTNSNV